MQKVDIIVIGGGAAGFFGAISAASKSKHSVLILEKSQKVLAKVGISGGGRCNVTHACFDPKELTKFYPRGNKELLGPFTRFQPQDTMQWFASHNVALKIEEDGRVFPVSDSSATIINCLTETAKNLKIDLQLGVHILEILRQEGGFYLRATQQDFFCKHLLLATGSSPSGHRFALGLGHTITPLAPSLFTFNIPTSPLLDLAGIALDRVVLHLPEVGLRSEGAFLLTHWGFSGPAVLKLSAWGAKDLQRLNYQTLLKIDWTAGMDKEALKRKIGERPPQQVLSLDHFADIPKQLNKRLMHMHGVATKRYAELSKKEIEHLVQILTEDTFTIDGKTTYKQEFVTCGGVKLSEVNFKTMESKICPGLYFAGEILDIDGVTGGFNFQNGWTTGYIAGEAMA